MQSNVYRINEAAFSADWFPALIDDTAGRSWYWGIWTWFHFYSSDNILIVHHPNIGCQTNNWSLHINFSSASIIWPFKKDPRQSEDEYEWGEYPFRHRRTLIKASPLPPLSSPKLWVVISVIWVISSQMIWADFVTKGQQVMQKCEWKLPSLPRNTAKCEWRWGQPALSLCLSL